jgi:hypothetical protein
VVKVLRISSEFIGRLYLSVLRCIIAASNGGFFQNKHPTNLNSGVFLLTSRKSTIEMASIENNFTMIRHPSDPGVWRLLTEQLSFVKTIFTGRVKQLDPSITAVSDVANWVQS